MYESEFKLFAEVDVVSVKNTVIDLENCISDDCIINKKVIMFALSNTLRISDDFNFNITVYNILTVISNQPRLECSVFDDPTRQIIIDSLSCLIAINSDHMLPDMTNLKI